MSHRSPGTVAEKFTSGVRTSKCIPRLGTHCPVPSKKADNLRLSGRQIRVSSPPFRTECLAPSAGLCKIFALHQIWEGVVPHKPSSTDDGGQPHLEDDRAEWIRPTLHRLNINSAEHLQKLSNDGQQGKGIST